jgi:hypothetical protein
MITIGTYAFVLLLLLAIDRANSSLASAAPPQVASGSTVIRTTHVRALDDGLHRDLMRWENEGGRIDADGHETHGGLW